MRPIPDGSPTQWGPFRLTVQGDRVLFAREDGAHDDWAIRRVFDCLGAMLVIQMWREARNKDARIVRQGLSVDKIRQLLDTLRGDGGRFAGANGERLISAAARMDRDVLGGLRWFKNRRMTVTHAQRLKTDTLLWCGGQLRDAVNLTASAALPTGSQFWDGWIRAAIDVVASDFPDGMRERAVDHEQGLRRRTRRFGKKIISLTTTYPRRCRGARGNKLKQLSSNVGPPIKWRTPSRWNPAHPTTFARDSLTWRSTILAVAALLSLCLDTSRNGDSNTDARPASRAIRLSGQQTGGRRSNRKPEISPTTS